MIAPGETYLIQTEKCDAACQVAEALHALGHGEGDFIGQAADIKKKCSKKGFLQGGAFTILWTDGHLGEDLKPEAINNEYKLDFVYNNSFDYKMPGLLEEMKRVVKPKKAFLAKVIRDMLNKRSFDRYYICTDGDAEGERIAHDAFFVFGGLDRNLDIRRMWVTGAFSNPQMIKEQLETALPYNDHKYARLLDTQKARSNGDYIQGMKSTKLLVDRYGRKLYSGRVKNTIVGLVGDRELEIQNFVSKKYYTIKGTANGIELSHFFYKMVEDIDESGKLVNKKTKSTRYFSEKQKDRVVDEIEHANRTGTVTGYQTKPGSSRERPLPLSGDDFKSLMANEQSLTLKQSGEVLQQLRDEGFTTYQGTNGRYFFTADANLVKTAYETALAVFTGKPAVASAKFSVDAYLFNDKEAAKQNHPPLHLTGKVPTEADYRRWENSKTKGLREGYELIAKRILVHFLEPDSYENVRLELDIAGHQFEKTGVRPIEQGWRKFTGDLKPNTFFNMPVEKGDRIGLDALTVDEKSTTKPKPYTERELLETLMNVSRVLNNMIEEETDPERLLRLKKAKVILKDVEGIGTDRTREQILDDMDGNQLLVTKKKITLSDIGWVMYKVLPEALRSVLFTAAWEADFEAIRRGEKSYADVIGSINGHLEQSISYMLEHVDHSLVVKKAEAKPISAQCPLCGATIMDAGGVFRCEKNIFANGKQTGCKFKIFKNQKQLEARFNEKMILRLLAGEILESPNGNKIHLDLQNDFFTKIIYREPAEDEVVETEKTFRMGKTFCFKSCFGKNLTPAQAKRILSGKEVELQRTSKKNKKPYTVTVWLEEDGKLGHNFG